LDTKLKSLYKLGGDLGHQTQSLAMTARNIYPIKLVLLNGLVPFVMGLAGQRRRRCWSKITPKFVKTFDREKPRTIWYNTVKALDSDMKLHDAIVDWCTKSAGEIMNSINLKCQSPNIIMCLLAMDGLNEVMPQSKGVKFTESVQ